MRHITYLIAVVRSCETLEQLIVAEEWAKRAIKFNVNDQKMQQSAMRFIDNHIRLQQSQRRIRDAIEFLELE